MPFKIIRNDITKMNTEAIVNTANEDVTFGSGCDSAVYQAAGQKELLKYRQENIGRVRTGQAFITPGFCLQAKYIIHAVSPRFIDGRHGEEKGLRDCYRNSLKLAGDKGIKSIAFPLISAGSFGYPREEAMRIAADEINSFLLSNDMEIYLVVFGDQEACLGKKLYPGLKEYIDRNYVQVATAQEYGGFAPSVNLPSDSDIYSDLYSKASRKHVPGQKRKEQAVSDFTETFASSRDALCEKGMLAKPTEIKGTAAKPSESRSTVSESSEVKGMVAEPCLDFEEVHLDQLEERMKHMTDTYSQYLLYLIRSKNMENAEVYKRAIVDKKIFSKIKNNKNYHPNKLTALCLCVGAMLNLDESRDLLARAGYALSPCDKTDIIFSYFIENKIYDMIELDIQLEEHDLPCIIA